MAAWQHHGNTMATPWQHHGNTMATPWQHLPDTSPPPPPHHPTTSRKAVDSAPLPVSTVSVTTYFLADVALSSCLSLIVQHLAGNGQFGGRLSRFSFDSLT